MSEVQNQDEEVTKVDVVSGLNPRNSALEDIAERVYEKKKDELTPLEEDGESPAPNAPPKAEEATAETDSPQPETPPAEPNTGPEMVTIKVDGQEIQRPKAEVEENGGVKAYQMLLAAAKRLEEARQIKAQAHADAQRFNAPQAQQQQPPDPRAALIEKVRFGTEDEALAAVQELTKANQLTPEQIAHIAREEYSRTSAVEKFKQDFQDIVADPYLLKLAVNREYELRASGDRRSYSDVYQDIGNELRKWRGATVNTLQDKQEKKATITNIPQAKARAPVPEEPKELTTAQVIEQMRKARKQM